MVRCAKRGDSKTGLSLQLSIVRQTVERHARGVGGAVFLGPAEEIFPPRRGILHPFDPGHPWL